VPRAVITPPNRFHFHFYRLYQSVEALQADLDAWLRHYNHERPHLGYRNQGRRPWDTVERFVSQSPTIQGG
jgi:hypothetical protein